MREGTIVTFYSYKGGVGRTFALANIGTLLSLWGYKTLCVDWDLEAPGLHLYFKQWMSKRNYRGLTELIEAHANGKKPNWKDYIEEVHLPNAKESLLLMSAGRQDNLYVQHMQALNWTELYETHNLGNFLEELRIAWKESLDFVLIDSRTGITDIGGICTVQLPDLLVLLLTTNDQSLYGSLDVLDRMTSARSGLPLDRAKLLVLPIVSRFEGRVEYALAQEWLATFAKLLAPIYSEWAQKDVVVSDLLNFTRIPYIPYWSFGEKLPAIEKGTEDPDDIGFSLETLSALLAQRLSHSDVLIKNRDSFLTATKNEGDDLHKKNRYSKGLAAYEQTIADYEEPFSLSSYNASDYIAKGDLLSSLYEYSEALVAYEKAILLDPSNANASNGKGNALYNLERYEEALTAYEQAISLDPNNVDAYEGKGDALYNLERYEEALTAYEQAISLDPNNVDTYNGKGDALYNLERYEEALTAYEQAMLLDPNNSDAYVGREDALKQVRRWNKE